MTIHLGGYQVGFAFDQAKDKQIDRLYLTTWQLAYVDFHSILTITNLNGKHWLAWGSFRFTAVFYDANGEMDPRQLFERPEISDMANE